MRAFWATINPDNVEHDRWHWSRLTVGEVVAWPLAQSSARAHAKRAVVGDPVVGYSGGQRKHIEALLQVATRDDGVFSLRLLARLERPVARKALAEDGRLDDMAYFRSPRVSFLSLAEDEWNAIAEHIGAADQCVGRLLIRNRWVARNKPRYEKVFIAGVIQGSLEGKAIRNQNYRERITQAVRAALPRAEVVDPYALHSDSIEYDDAAACATFEAMVEQARKSDLVIAYLPEASMGTAIEMWVARSNGVEVWTITTLEHNWIVRLYSDRVFEDVESFAAALAEL